MINSDRLRSTTKEDNNEKFAKIWFQALARFHRVPPLVSWQFNREQVLAYLRDRLSNGVPTWNRLKIVEGEGHWCLVGICSKLAFEALTWWAW